MTFDYQIAAIPTLYRGRQYRSRLEAKWAAFFDLAGWRYEYEPFDLGGWSPDFLLDGGDEHPSALVEIKPITEIDPAVCRKMEAARGDDRKYRLVLLGVRPWLPADEKELYSYGMMIGWAKTKASATSWGQASLHGVGKVLGQSTSHAVSFTSMCTWNEACNAVQWRPAVASSPETEAHRKQTARTIFKMLRAGFSAHRALERARADNAARSVPLTHETVNEIALWCAEQPLHRRH